MACSSWCSSETFRCPSCGSLLEVQVHRFSCDGPRSTVPACSSCGTATVYVPSNRTRRLSSGNEGHAALYVNPNDPSDWQQAPSSDPNDPQNARFAREGYQRREFHSIHDYRAFVREQNDGDPHGQRGYNDVLDYDHGSRQRGEGREWEGIRERDRRMDEAYAHVRGSSGRYERAKRDTERRRS